MKLRLLLLLLPFSALAQIAPIQKQEVSDYSCSNEAKSIELSMSFKKDQSVLKPESASTQKEAVNVISVLASYDNTEELNQYLRNYSQSGKTDIFSNQNALLAIDHFKNVVIPAIDQNLQNKDLIKYVQYIRALDWHAYYENEVQMSTQFLDKLIVAFKDLNANPVFWSNTQAMEDIRWEATLIADIEFRRGELWSTFMDIMQKRDGASLDAVSAIIWRGLMNRDYSMLIKLYSDSSFIATTYDIIKTKNTNTSNNYINILGLILDRHRTYLQNVTAPFAIDQYLNMIRQLFTDFQFGTPQHIKLIGILVNEQSYYQFNVDFEQLKQQYYEDQFSNEVAFENGEIVIHSSLSEERINEMYLALREAKANFFKLAKDITPVDGDPNPNIDLYIFKSGSDYGSLGGLFFNIPTNNGGIYIENHGALYTFERESDLLPLSMLLKHEYVHYLDGRYNIHGTFGEKSFYDWGPGRYVWWTEGLANYVASADLELGFYISAYSANWIWGDQGDHLSLETSLRNSYNYGGRMYAYSEAAWGYLNSTEPAKINQMFRLVHSDQIEDFWSLVDSIAFNKNLQPSYTSYLDQVASNWNQNLISDPIDFNYDFSMTEVALDSLKSVIDITSLLQDYSATVPYNTPYKLVKLSKSITYTDDLDSAIQKIDQYLQDVVIQFHQKSEEYTGFNIITAWVESVEATADQIKFNIAFEIPLNGEFKPAPDPVDPDPVDPDPVDPDPVDPDPVDPDPIDPTEPEIIGLVLFPNPTVDVINIVNVKSGDQIAIFNLSGSILYQGTLSSNKFSYDMSRYQTGIYVVNILQDGKRHSIKFIKR